MAREIRLLSRDSFTLGKIMCSLYFSFYSRKLFSSFSNYICSEFRSLEAFARTSVSGFLLDPEIPTSSLFAAPFATHIDPSMVPTSAADPNHSMARSGSLNHSNSTRRHPTRGNSLMYRLRQLRYNLMRPFALRQTSLSAPARGAGNPPATPGKTTRRRSDTVQSNTPMMEKLNDVHSKFRNPSQPSFLSTAFKSDNDDMLSLPFRLSIARANTATLRNLPYLRQSWNRIDFVAVLGFWVSFALAMAGVERGAYHIGVFRALSVLRTARLLAITSGTTVRITYSLSIQVTSY